jgi:Xaa-Pro aminopeptidase
LSTSFLVTLPQILNINLNMYPERLSELRSELGKNKVDAYVIQCTDPHLGEYIPDHWQVVAWLTGFNGSNATVVITESFAGLWTDSRYFIQAEEQLRGSGFTFMKQLTADRKDFMLWLKDNIRPGSVIGFDGRTFSIQLFRKLVSMLEGLNLSFQTDSDFISGLWKERPPMPGSVAFDHEIRFCGKDRSVKISEVRALMKEIGVNYHLLTSLDDIMWLLNIRGRDVAYSPLLTCFAIIGEDQVLLFTDEGQIPLRMALLFDKLNIVMLPYEETAGMLTVLPGDCSMLICPETTSVTLFNSIKKGARILEDNSIPTRLKAEKNKAEIENIGRVMVKDGIALTKFFIWLEKEIGENELSELSVASMVDSLRAVHENYLCPSFLTISAFREHSALPHYSVTGLSDSRITGEGIFLLDSGGQYLDGTTDITRTISIGRPTDQQKRDFTLVLKGVIKLASAKFPAGTRGYQLDILARRSLWENGLNYGHGTGHGVGFCLNVHEGPQNISPAGGNNSRTVIVPGMLISDEPAVYREGEYGIRTENLLMCYEDEENEFGNFYRFETMSLCYIDKNLIEKRLLEINEIEWLNSYHERVFEKLSPHLEAEEIEWLRDKTSPM